MVFCFVDDFLLKAFIELSAHVYNSITGIMVAATFFLFHFYVFCNLKFFYLLVCVNLLSFRMILGLLPPPSNIFNFSIGS